MGRVEQVTHPDLPLIGAGLVLGGYVFIDFDW